MADAPLPEALAAAYEAAQFEVWLPGGRVVFVHQRPPEGAVAALPPATTLTVVTAYNPGTCRPSPAANARAQQRLERTLRARGLTYYPAAGYSPDRRHQEPSCAVLGLTPEQALRLAAEFHQAAILFHDGTTARVLYRC